MVGFKVSQSRDPRNRELIGEVNRLLEEAEKERSDRAVNAVREQTIRMGFALDPEDVGLAFEMIEVLEEMGHWVESDKGGKP